jgi:hypothetical protein
MIEAATIDRYFDRYGWAVERTSEDSWRTTFRGELALYPLYVRLTEKYLFLSIVPFLLKPKPEAAQRFYWAMLRYNRDMNLAKLALDPDGDVVLTIELPLDGFDYPTFEQALSLLSYYADLTYRELLNLSQDPRQPSRYDEGQGLEGEGLRA